MLLGWFTGVCGLLIITIGDPFPNGLIPFDTEVFVMSLFLLPVFDAARIILIRLSKGVHPFSADRRHMHHVLQDLGFQGLDTTAILWARIA